MLTRGEKCRGNDVLSCGLRVHGAPFLITLSHVHRSIFSLWKRCLWRSREFWPMSAKHCTELPKAATSFCQLEFLSPPVRRTLCITGCLQCRPSFGIHSEPFQDFQTFLPTTHPGLLSVVFLGSLLPCGFSCTFEKDFCSWNQSSTDSFDWRRHKGPTPSPDTGPLYDHTTGGEAGTLVLPRFPEEQILVLFLLW